MSEKNFNVYMQPHSEILETAKLKKENQMKLLKQQAEANREYERNRERTQLEEARIKHSLNIENYKYIDTISFENSPYVLSGIEPNEKYLSRSYSGSFSYIKDEYPDMYDKVNFIAIEKAREIIKQNILNGKIKLLDKGKVIKTITNVSSYTRIEIIEIVKWLDYEKYLDPNFPLMLPEELVMYVKERNKNVKTFKVMLAERDTLLSQNEQYREDILFLMGKDYQQFFMLFVRNVKKLLKSIFPEYELDLYLARGALAECLNIFITKDGGQGQVTHNSFSNNKSLLSYDSINNYLKEFIPNEGKRGNKSKKEKKKYEEILKNCMPYLKGSEFDIFREVYNKYL